MLSAAFALLGYSVSKGALTRFQKLPLLARLFCAAALTMPLVQLVPLPPILWHAIPGREIEYHIIELAGGWGNWRPITLDPLATLRTFLIMIPAAASFAAVMVLRRNARWILLGGVIIFAVITIVIGAFQFSSRGALLNFYQSRHGEFLLGFFANKNHTGLFLAIALVFAIFFLFRNLRAGQTTALTAGLATAFVLAAEIGTTSRAGLALAFLAAPVAYLTARPSGWPGLRLKLGIVAGAMLVGLAGFALNDTIRTSLARYSDVAEDGRRHIWANTTQILIEYLPFGSGLGTYVPVYAKHEELDEITAFYVNHAHNDYLELLVETGLFGVLVLLLFLAACGAVMLRERLLPRSTLSKAGAIAIMLVAMHSFVDYPLRRIAIAALFGTALSLWWCRVAEIGGSEPTRPD